MRRAFNDMGFQTSGKRGKNLVALSLGFDFTAEHEWGIEDLQQLCGSLHPKKKGIERYRVTKTPEDYKIVETDDYTAIGIFRTEPSRGYPNRELEISRPWGDHAPETMTSAWSGRDFGVLATDDLGRRRLREIHKAFLDGDVALFIGAHRLLPGYKFGGLTLAIISHMPKPMLDALKEKHLEREKLEKATRAAEKSSKLLETLKKANLKWFALSPMWARPEEKTKYKIS